MSNRAKIGLGNDSRNDSNPCVAKSDARGIAYGVRLRNIRESTGRSPQEVADRLGISLLEYDELEAIAGTLNRSTSLTQLLQLSSVLNVSTRFIFEDEGRENDRISCKELCTNIKSYLERTGTGISEFEERVGYEIRQTLEDPAKVMDWNVDCLRFVCSEIGTNWLTALP